MAIDMQKFSEAYESLEVNVRNDFFEILKSQETEIKMRIKDILKRTLGLDENTAQRFIQDELMEPLYNKGAWVAEIICEKIDTITAYTSRLVDQTGTIRGESWFNVLRNELTRNMDFNVLSPVVEDFVSRIPKFSEIRLGRELTSDEIFKSKAEVNTIMKPIISASTEEIKKVLNEHCNSFCASFNLFRKNEIANGKFNELKKAASYLGYEVTKDGQESVLVSPNGEKVSIIANQDGTYSAGDITINLNNENQTIIYHGNDSLIVDQDFIAFGSITSPYNMQINRGFLEYTFLCAGEPLDEPIKINLIVTSLKRNYPTLYNSCYSDPAFKEVVDASLKAKEENEKIIVDGNGITHLNPDNSSELITYLGVIGYTPIEKDDGVYLVNELGEFKIEYKNEAIILPDGSHISLDFYIVGPNGIKGPDIYYKNREKQVSLFFEEDFSQIDLITEKGHFRTYVSEDEIKHHAKLGDFDYKDADLIEDAFNSYFPSVLEKLKSTHTKTPTEDLLTELEETPEVVNVNSGQSINDRLYALMQDPKVQEYLVLKEESEKLNNEPLGPIL